MEADNCAFDRMPERCLENLLAGGSGRAVRVFSLAAAGYGQDQEHLALQEFFRTYSADLVVVWETPDNDVWNNMFPTHWPKDGAPKPTFWLEGDALKGPSYSLSRNPSKHLSLMGQVVFRPSLDDLWEELHLPSAYEPRTKSAVVAIEDWYVLNQARENIENGKTHVGLSLVPVSARTKYGVRLANKLLTAMCQVSKEHGARFCAFTVERPDFPLPSGVYKIDVRGRTLYPELSKEQYWKNVANMNANLDFFTVSISGKNFMSGSDCHLNTDAVKRVMEKVAICIKRRMDD